MYSRFLRYTIQFHYPKFSGYRTYSFHKKPVSLPHLNYPTMALLNSDQRKLKPDFVLLFPLPFWLLRVLLHESSKAFQSEKFLILLLLLHSLLLHEASYLRLDFDRMKILCLHLLQYVQKQVSYALSHPDTDKLYLFPVLLPYLLASFPDCHFQLFR